MGIIDKDKFKPRYADFGKVFLRSERGALEYSTLDRSDDEIALGTKDLYLKELATFEKSRAGAMLPLRADLGSTSVALIQWETNGFLFIHAQRRYENEFVPSGTSPLTNRAFNQVRLTYLTNEIIRDLLVKQKVGLYSSLLYCNSSFGDAGKLKDYIEPERGKITAWINYSCKNISLTDVDSNLLTQIVNSLYAVYSKADINNDIELPKVAILIPNMSLIEKIHLIDMIQHLIFPVLGVFTFALDYVTDRKVTMYLHDKIQNSGPASKARRLDLSKSFSFNYYNAVSQLSQDHLDHETLSYYLKRGLDPHIGVALFRLVETDFHFDADEELDLIRIYGHEISSEHWNKLINRRFSATTKTIKLLEVALPKFRYEILRQVLRSTGRKLSAYIPYHLAAITGLETAEKTAAKSYRALLRETIRNSTPEDLSQIPGHLELPAYTELILADFEYRGESRSVPSPELLAFSNGTHEETKIRSVTQVVLSLVNDNLFEKLIAALPPGFRDLLIQEIFIDIEYVLRSWDVRKTLGFWSSLPEKSPNHFIKILQLLLTSGAKQIELKNIPVEFKKFLISGSGILFQQYASQETGLHSLGRKRPSILTLLKENVPANNGEIGSLLRTTSLEICFPYQEENASFAAWWLLSELAYMDFATVAKDYSEILERYKSEKRLNAWAISQEAIFLLSGGKFVNGLSLCNACIQFDNDLPLPIANDELLQYIVHVWQARNITIPRADIDFFIDKLPDDIANATLAKIVVGTSSAQAIEIQELRPEVALLWLQRATKQLREPYKSKGRDRLYDLLTRLNHVNDELLRQLIIDESATYPVSGKWKDYLNNVAQIVKTHGRLVSSDQFIVEYLNLARNFTDRAGNGAKNRAILKWMVTLYFTHPNQDIEVSENKLLILLLYAKTESAKLLQQRVDLLLTRCLLGKGFSDTLSTLRNESLHALHKYVLSKKLEKSIHQLIDREISRRQGDTTSGKLYG